MLFSFLTLSLSPAREVMVWHFRPGRMKQLTFTNLETPRHTYGKLFLWLNYTTSYLVCVCVCSGFSRLQRVFVFLLPFPVQFHFHVDCCSLSHLLTVFWCIFVFRYLFKFSFPFRHNFSFTLTHSTQHIRSISLVSISLCLSFSPSLARSLS